MFQKICRLTKTFYFSEHSHNNKKPPTVLFYTINNVMQKQFFLFFLFFLIKCIEFQILRYLVLIDMLYSIFLTTLSATLRTYRQIVLDYSHLFEFCFQANIYLFKVINRKIRKRCEICSKLTIKSPKRCHWRRSSVFIVNFANISCLFRCFYFWLWTSYCLLFRPSETSEMRSVTT